MQKMFQTKVTNVSKIVFLNAIFDPFQKIMTQSETILWKIFDWILWKWQRIQSWSGEVDVKFVSPSKKVGPNLKPYYEIFLFEFYENGK